MALLEIKNVSKVFNTNEGDVLALENVNFNVEQGELMAIIGPSGCGKSTLLRILAGLTRPTTGEVWLNGHKIEKTDPALSFIFQNFALFPWLNVFENVAFPLKMIGLPKSEIHKKTESIIKDVGLAGFETSHPKQLSGGMKQRVGIARALNGDSQIILADEPFSSLDAFTAKILRDELLDIWGKYRKTVIIVTHLVEEAAYLADRIVVISPRPGRVEKTIQNNMSRPRKPRSEKFYKLSDELTSIVQP